MQATAIDTRTNRLTYAIDSDHAVAHFKVRHLMISHVRGELGKIVGEAKIDPTDLARSEIFTMIDAVAIDTRNPQRDAHLRSADFLDTDNFPVITFRSTRVIVLGDATLDVVGNLTIGGVTREVTLRTELSGDIRDPWGNVKRGVTATTRIRRQDYGLRWNAVLEAGGFAVGDDVDITIELELTRK